MGEFRYTINDKNGIHARPAGLIVQASRGYASDISLAFGDRHADCKKLFQLMQLGVKQGDEVTVTATGADSADALSDLEALMRRAGL